MATYTKGGSTDTWTFSGAVSVGGTMAVTGAQTFAGALALGAITDAAGFTLTDTTTRGAGLFTELPSTGTAISAGKVIHGVESRFVINKDQTTTNDTSLYALTGHLRVKQDLPASSAFGVWSYFEQSGIVTTPFAGALRAKVEGEAGLTATKLYGILVDGHVASAATATEFAAIRIAKDIEGSGGMKAWGNGILVDAGATDIVMKVGAQSSTESLGHVLTGTNNRVISLFADTGAAALAGDVQMINARLVFLPGVDQTGAGAASVIRGHLRVAGADLNGSESKAWMGLAGVFESDGTHTIGGTAQTIVAAISGTAEVGGAPTVAAGSTVAGLHLVGKWTGTGYAPSGEFVGIYFQSHTQGFEPAFGFSGTGATDGNGLTAGDITGETKGYKIAVRIDGVGTKYIQLYGN